MVRIDPPPSRRRQKANPPNPIFSVLPTGTRLVRIYDPASHGAGPLTFRTFGPLLRFDHHVGIGAGRKRKPQDDPARGILYAGFTLSCCMVEIFGDTRLVSSGSRHVAEIEVTRDLRLLDLREGAMGAGTVAALASTEHHYKAQEWSRRFYDDPAYTYPDGIWYRCAHNGEDGFALYERASDALLCAPSSTMRLDDPLLRPEIQRIMHKELLNWAP